MATISKAKVVEINHFGTEIREYILKLDKNNFFESGTFLQLTLENKENYTRWPECRNFSIASAHNKDGLIRLIIQRVGVYTSRIFDELTIGKYCTVKYAFGDFMLPFYDKTSPICCIAGGTGVVPILSFCEELAENKQLNRLHVFYSFKNETEAVSIDELKKYVPEKQLHLFSTRQEIRNVTYRRIAKEDILESKLDLQKTHFYICGASDFTKYFKDSLESCGSENVYTDEW